MSSDAMADFSVDRGSGAEARFLASDEGSIVSAWVGAAIAMVGMLVTACALGAAAFVYQRHRNRSVTREVQKMTVQGTDCGSKKPEAWADPEIGGDRVETSIDKASPVHDEAVVSDKLSASVRLELAETLRGILTDEISRGLKASGISDRLDRLEQQAREQQVLSGSLLPPAAKVPPPNYELDHTLKAQASSVPSLPEWAATLKPEAKATTPEIETRDASTLTDPVTEAESSQPGMARKDSDMHGARRDLTLSPSLRQKRYADPPEKGWMHIDEDRSMRLSLGTIQRNLHKRDGQTQELHRQLRQTQQDCLAQKLEATHAVKKLQDLLSDPSYAPQAQALELKNLRQHFQDVSRRLADSKQSEQHWQLAAKRHSAFIMQSKRVAQEEQNLFRKHPAGELFLAEEPPPIYLDDDEDPRRAPWDIANSHINPYANDSWPFEPNACAQRCAVEPNLGRWDEEDGIESDSEEGGSEGSGDERAQLMLRLPTLPPESPHDQEFEPPEEPPPALGLGFGEQPRSDAMEKEALSARSL